MGVSILCGFEPWVEILIVMKPEDLTSKEYHLELEKVFLNIMAMYGEIFQ